MVKSRQETVNSLWVLIEIVVRNQNDEKGRYRRGHGRVPADLAVRNLNQEPVPGFGQ